jgi:O-succinylbenzoic acid--CoA ligase
MLVESWLERAAAARPRATAIEAPDGCLSYGELLCWAERFAQWLADRGAAEGDRIVLDLPAGAGFALALHGALLAGAVAVPLDPRLAEHERAKVVEGACLTVNRGALKGEGGGVDILDANARVRAPAPARPLARKKGTPHTHPLDRPAIVVFTSGTSATPKAVEITFGNLLWSALGSAVALGLDAQERWLCTMPLAHVGGLSILLRSAIYGTTAVVHERFDTEEALAVLRTGRITLVSLVPTTLERLLDAGLEHPPWLRCALVGGGPVPAQLLERARQVGVPARPTYGLSEACSQVATAPVHSETEGPKPLFCARLRIDETGEILVSGPVVAPGAAGADGWLRTGDLGRIDAAGALHVEGRKSDLIVSGGENVSPAEVEGALERHPDVLEAAVIGSPDERWGEAVTAVVVMRQGATTRSGALQAHCGTLLAGYKVPKRIEPVAGPLPRTASGKLLRRLLRKPSDAGPASGTAPSARPVPAAQVSDEQ